MSLPGQEASSPLQVLLDISLEAASKQRGTEAGAGRLEPGSSRGEPAQSSSSVPAAAVTQSSFPSVQQLHIKHWSPGLDTHILPKPGSHSRAHTLPGPLT